MSGLTPTEALAQLAATCKVDGFRSTHYPAPAQLPNPPAILVFWDGLQILGAYDQTWVMRARVHLMVALVGDTPREIGILDPLLMRVVDAFMGDQPGYHLYDAERRGVDHCIFLNDPPANLTRILGYGGHSYYGHELFYEIKLRRLPGEGY